MCASFRIIGDGSIGHHGWLTDRLGRFDTGEAIGLGLLDPVALGVKFVDTEGFGRRRNWPVFLVPYLVSEVGGDF